METGSHPRNLKWWEAMESQRTGNWAWAAIIGPWNSWSRYCKWGEEGQCFRSNSHWVMGELWGSSETSGERHPSFTASWKVHPWWYWQMRDTEPLRWEWSFWIGVFAEKFLPEAQVRVDCQTSGRQSRAKRTFKGWRDGSVVKSTDCSSRGHKFNSQQPHGGSQPSVIESDALFWCVWKQLQCAHINITNKS